MIKRLFAAALAAAMLLTGAGALAEGAGEIAAAAITVQGNATVTAAADIVTVTANASVQAGSILEAQQQVSAIVADATAKLLELGVLDADVVTTDYSYYPNYNYDGETRRLIGYQANHTLEITCRDVEMLDGVLGVVTDSGIGEVYNVSYGVADRGALYNQALELAIAAAESKAVSMAAASGKTISRLSSLTENQSYDARFAVNASAKGAVTEDAAAGISPGIRAGGVSVSASVTAVYTAN